MQDHAGEEAGLSEARAEAQKNKADRPPGEHKGT
jgi:hypothetical protein